MNMSEKNKRKVNFAEIDEENKKQKSTTNDTRLHSRKYALDSDEEDDDNQDDNKEMNQNDLDGSFECIFFYSIRE
jgi:hypothetical protein